MIYSIGIDIIEVSRIKSAIDRWGDVFLRRIYTPWEITYCHKKKFPEQSFAARFAAKEAVLKAVILVLCRVTRSRMIKATNDELGHPTVRLGERVQKIIGNKEIRISMSHTVNFAVANAIMYDDLKA